MEGLIGLNLSRYPVTIEPEQNCKSAYGYHRQPKGAMEKQTLQEQQAAKYDEDEGRQ